MMTITVGRMTVNMNLRRDENVCEDHTSGVWYAEYKICDGSWEKLGTYNTKAEAYKALYINRPDFSAAYGA
jgi:hypothetical protein